MKVRIEFDWQPGHDPESRYDVVEFQTSRASSVDAWAEAVADFVRPANYNSNLIVLAAACNVVPFQPPRSWLEENRFFIECLRDELTKMLTESKQ